MFGFGGICHPESTSLEGRKIACGTCGKVLYDDVCDYFLSLDPYSSCHAADIYAKSTGDLSELKCRVGVEGLQGIMTYASVVRYETLLQVIRILGIMNSEFVSYGNDGMLFDRTAVLNCKIMDCFLERLETQLRDASVAEMHQKDMLDLVRGMMDHLKRMAKDNGCNVVDMFLNTYVPYVKRVAGEQPAIGRHLDVDSPGLTFKDLNRDAEIIRSMYGPSSLQFDLVYVLVYVYLFCECGNTDLVVNFVLDFVARLCSGRYDVRHPIHSESERYLASRIRRSRNSGDLNRLVAQMRLRGSCVELLSLENVRRVKTLQELFSSRFAEVAWKWPADPRVVAYAESQMFPYVLFSQGDTQYYGFVLGLSYLAKHMDKKTGTLRKGVLGKAKGALRFVDEYMSKVRQFRPAYWTKDAFKLFVGSDEGFLNSLRLFAEEFLGSDMETETW